MSTTFIVIKANKESGCILHDADVFLRNRKGKWSLVIESPTALEIIQLPRRDLAIEEFERICTEITSGSKAVLITEKYPG